MNQVPSFASAAQNGRFRTTAITGSPPSVAMGIESDTQTTPNPKLANGQREYVATPTSSAGIVV